MKRQDHTKWSILHSGTPPCGEKLEHHYTPSTSGSANHGKPVSHFLISAPLAFSDRLAIINGHPPSAASPSPARIILRGRKCIPFRKRDKDCLYRYIPLPHTHTDEDLNNLVALVMKCARAGNVVPVFLFFLLCSLGSGRHRCR